MARGAKVNSRDAYFQTSSEDDSECEDSGSSLGDPEELSQELALLVKKFQKFSRRGRLGKSSMSNETWSLHSRLSSVG